MKRHCTEDWHRCVSRICPECYSNCSAGTRHNSGISKLLGPCRRVCRMTCFALLLFISCSCSQTVQPLKSHRSLQSKRLPVRIMSSRRDADKSSSFRAVVSLPASPPLSASASTILSIYSCPCSVASPLLWSFLWISSNNLLVCSFASLLPFDCAASYNSNILSPPCLN